MDFIVGLPKIQSNFGSLIVVVNRLTKIAYFISTITIVTAYRNVELFIRENFKHHENLREFMNDRCRKFVSDLWTIQFKLCGIKIKSSTVYHPKTDGQTERTNKTLEDMLRMYVDKNQHSWDKWLHMIEFAYNDDIHSCIGVGPLKLY